MRSWRLIVFGVLAVILWTRFTGGLNPVGTQLPPLLVEYLPGSDPYTIGEPAIVEFWATWCPPCRESIAHLNELKKSGRELNLQIIGITDEDEETVTRFRRSTRMDYSVALDPGRSIFRHFKVRGIPYAVLVDAMGKVRWAGHPGELNEFQIREALR